jgi:hypothetical protein
VAAVPIASQSRIKKKLEVSGIISPFTLDEGVGEQCVGSKRDEVIGGWRKLRNEEVHNLYSSPNIIRTFKLRRIRWAGYAARIGRTGIHIGFWW